jgi:DNA polymerase III delta subunit
MRESDLETQDAELLANKVGGSYDLAMLEIDKIHQYGESTDKVDSAAFHDLLNSGVIYQPQEVTVFDFVDKVCNRKLEAFDLAQVLLDNKVSSINILGTLYNSMKSVLLIQCCTSRDIGNVTGLDNGQIYFNRKYVNRYRTDKLVEIVQFLIDVIDGIKSGRIEDGYALKYSLVHIFN